MSHEDDIVGFLAKKKNKASRGCACPVKRNVRRVFSVGRTNYKHLFCHMNLLGWLRLGWLEIC